MVKFTTERGVRNVTGKWANVFANGEKIGEVIVDAGCGYYHANYEFRRNS